MFDVDDVKRMIDQIRYYDKKFLIVRSATFICRLDYDVSSIVILIDFDQIRHI